MKKAAKFLALIVALATTTAYAAPVNPGSNTNACSTNMARTNLTGTNVFLGPLSQFDANGDGSITTNEFAAASAAFVHQQQTNFLAKYDANNDGIISSAEILAVTQTAAERWVTNLLARYDRNKDGTLSTNAIRLGRGDHDGPPIAQLDVNGDGVISKAELVAGALALAEELQAEVLAKYDTNKDGNITTAEALAVHQGEADERIADILEQFDTNKDGTITAAEISAALHGHRGPGGPAGGPGPGRH